MGLIHGTARCRRRRCRSLRTRVLAKELTIPLTLPQVVDGDELTALRQLGTRITREVTKNKAVQLLEKVWK